MFHMQFLGDKGEDADGALYGGCGQVIIAGKGIRASHEAGEKSVPYVLNVLLLYRDISFL